MKKLWQRIWHEIYWSASAALNVCFKVEESHFQTSQKKLAEAGVSISSNQNETSFQSFFDPKQKKTENEKILHTPTPIDQLKDKYIRTLD